MDEIMKNKKIMITGSNGLVGRNLSSFLMRRGCYVVGLGRGENSNQNIDEYINFDLFLESPEAIKGFDGFDGFIHCAAILDDRDSVDLSYVNSLIMLNSLSLAEKLNAKCFFNISSIPIIGEPAILPINEEHPVIPKSKYHQSKYLTERICSQNASDMLVYSLRIPSPIGQGMKKSTIITHFIEQALANKHINVFGKGTRKQSYLDIEDLGAIILKFLSNNASVGVYNVASDEIIDNAELANLIKQKCSSESEIKFIGEDSLDSQVWDIDNSKLKTVVNDHHFVPFKETISKLIKNW